MNALRVSIVVPVLNEIALIAPFLRQLRKRAPAAEIIVADGGSSDGTADAARDLCDRLVEAPRSRARQLNAGAAVATGAIFLFLHVDAEIPPEAISEIERAIQGGGAVGGYFRVRLPRDRCVYRLTDSFAHYAGFVLRIRCGDHGFFCRRDVFEVLGGFLETPLMEDVEFYRALRRRGRVVALAARLKLSPRRYEKVGATRLTLAYGLIAMLYALGVPLKVLAGIYRRTCQPNE